MRKQSSGIYFSIHRSLRQNGCKSRSAKLLYASRRHSFWRKTVRLNRDLQREILHLYADAEPNEPARQDIDSIYERFDENTIVANLRYLEGHGLLENSLSRPAINAGQKWLDGIARITEKGQDFLMDDGGLSAILGVVTIKLHDDTLKALIGQKIEESDLALPDKRRWLDALRALPADATKHLTMKLLDLGLTHCPDALHAIQTVLNIGPK